jgi:hypothetical protein
MSKVKKRKSLSCSVKHWGNYSLLLLRTGAGQGAFSLYKHEKENTKSIAAEARFEDAGFQHKTAMWRALDILKSPTRLYAGLYNVLANGHMLPCVCLLCIGSNVHTKLENLRTSSDKRGIYICLLLLHTPLLVSGYLEGFF